ncbi:hypothetical protein ANO14919_059870 [Xylariales sp. No.14919]|nr:hypothetical protein ANO14919_059870 [Xylariales sp. No.14919]
MINHWEKRIKGPRMPLRQITHNPNAIHTSTRILKTNRNATQHPQIPRDTDLAGDHTRVPSDADLDAAPEPRLREREQQRLHVHADAERGLARERRAHAHEHADGGPEELEVAQHGPAASSCASASPVTMNRRQACVFVWLGACVASSRARSRAARGTGCGRYSRVEWRARMASSSSICVGGGDPASSLSASPIAIAESVRSGTAGIWARSPNVAPAATLVPDMFSVRAYLLFLIWYRAVQCWMCGGRLYDFAYVY